MENTRRGFRFRCCIDRLRPPIKSPLLYQLSYRVEHQQRTKLSDVDVAFARMHVGKNVGPPATATGERNLDTFAWAVDAHRVLARRDTSFQQFEGRCGSLVLVSARRIAQLE
jgi:hypothetical protein